MDCERLCGLPSPGVAGEVGLVRESFSPSVLAFCRGGSSDFGNESSRNLRLRDSMVEELRRRVVRCGGEVVDCTGELGDPAGLVSLVCRAFVRRLGDVGTGLFASRSWPCLAPFVLKSFPSETEFLRPFVEGERTRDTSLMERNRVASSSSSRSVLISLFSRVLLSLASSPSTTVSASDSLGASSELWSPFCRRGADGRRPLDDEGEAVFRALGEEASVGGEGGGWLRRAESSRAPAAMDDGFRAASPLLVITQYGSRTQEFLPHVGLVGARDGLRGGCGKNKALGCLHATHRPRRVACACACACLCRFVCLHREASSKSQRRMEQAR